jgi:hypothetical protein
MGITGWGDPSLIPISALARRGSARGHYGLIAACADRGRDSDVCDHHTEAEFNDQASQYTVNPLTLTQAFRRVKVNIADGLQY